MVRYKGIRELVRNYGPTAKVSSNSLTRAEIVCILLSLFVLFPLTLVLFCVIFAVIN